MVVSQKFVHLNVIPAEAGIQVLMVPRLRKYGVWIPACVGMTP